MSTATKPATAKKSSTRSTRTTKPAAAKGATAKAKPKANQEVSAAKKAKPAPKEQPAKPEAKTLIEALTTKQATLVKVRANGTKRGLPYLVPGSPERIKAEAVVKRTEKETLAAIAEDLKVSLATARRFVTNLALAQEVEAGEHDKAWTEGTKEVVVHTVVAKQAKA